MMEYVKFVCKLGRAAVFTKLCTHLCIVVSAISLIYNAKDAPHAGAGKQCGSDVHMKSSLRDVGMNVTGRLCMHV